MKSIEVMLTNGQSMFGEVDIEELNMLFSRKCITVVNGDDTIFVSLSQVIAIVEVKKEKK